MKALELLFAATTVYRVMLFRREVCSCRLLLTLESAGNYVNKLRSKQARQVYTAPQCCYCTPVARTNKQSRQRDFKHYVKTTQRLFRSYHNRVVLLNCYNRSKRTSKRTKMLRNPDTTLLHFSHFDSFYEK